MVSWPEDSKIFEIRKTYPVLIYMLRGILTSFSSQHQSEKGTRTVYHYQFLGWPEHGLPENVGSILGILLDINLKQKDFDYPIVVHCRYAPIAINPLSATPFFYSTQGFVVD